MLILEKLHAQSRLGQAHKNSCFSQPICEGARWYDQLVRLLVNGSSSGLKLKC